MDNIKVIVGQVWKSKITGHEIKICKKANVGFYISTGYATERVIQSDFIFIPQNDLEWLAINLKQYSKVMIDAKVFRDEFGIDVKYTYHDDGHECLYGRKTYTLLQLQNKRCELGIDQEGL